MTPLEIITKACEWVISTSVYVPSSQGIRDLNIVYDDFVSDMITELWERHFWNRLTGNTVVWQEEYTIYDTNSSPNYYIDQVERVAVKYSESDTDYTPCTRVDPANLEHDDLWYKVNQPNSAPIYFVRDNSVFIYPVATEAVTNGLKIDAILHPVALVIWDAETAVKIPKRFHQVLVNGVRKHIYFFLKLKNEEIAEENSYQSAKINSIYQMKWRNQEPAEIMEPNLNYFM